MIGNVQEDKLQSGKRGEDLAASYLEKKGYIILERNYRYRRGEIDLIAKKENLLVFVEVKLRSKTFFGQPEDAVDEKKAEKVLTTAENYIFETDWNGEVRYDIISIVDKKELVHFEDAFG